MDGGFIILVVVAVVAPLVAAQDHKRALAFDRGGNTGGMGAYSPAPVVTPQIHARAMREIIMPTLKGMEQDGIPYTGFLYAGLMIDAKGRRLSLADGGRVLLTARAADDLASAAINHDGVIEARTLATGEKGSIILLGDLERGSLVVDGRLDASAPVALPDGARFRLQLRSSEPAVIEVHAVNPLGEASDGPLWRGTVPANTAIDTARLRLAGTTGMETLRVLRRSLLDGSVSEQRVHLLHD